MKFKVKAGLKHELEDLRKNYEELVNKVVMNEMESERKFEELRSKYNKLTIKVHKKDETILKLEETVEELEGTIKNMKQQVISLDQYSPRRNSTYYNLPKKERERICPASDELDSSRESFVFKMRGGLKKNDFEELKKNYEDLKYKIDKHEKTGRCDKRRDSRRYTIIFDDDVE